MIKTVTICEECREIIKLDEGHAFMTFTYHDPSAVTESWAFPDGTILYLTFCTSFCRKQWVKAHPLEKMV